MHRTSMPHPGGGNTMKIYDFEIRGKSHVNLNIECQDCHKCIISEDGSTTITAVADGVGSSKFAKEGAQTAVNTAIEICRKHFPIEKNPEDFKAVIRMAMIAAEKEIIRLGGKRTVIHAQLRVKEFYETLGYTTYGDIDLEEGVEHIMMEKNL